MRIFCLHDDIGEEIRQRKEKGTGETFKTVHLKPLRKGEIFYCAAACWFAGDASWAEMKQEIKDNRAEIERASSLILTAKDLDEGCTSPRFLLAVEGMCGVDRHVRKRVKAMYAEGVRIASLTWNEFNALATGNGGDPVRGLTEKGTKAIRAMNECHMIPDVSHANEHTFWDILRVSKRPVIATHSNSRTICGAERNLTDQQIIAIAERGGLIGLNSYGPFISRETSERSAAGLAKHARYISSIVGHEHVACGFDFMDRIDYLEEKETHDISAAAMAQNFIEALRAEQFSEAEIENIAYRNVFRFLRENL